MKKFRILFLLALMVPATAFSQDSNVFYRVYAANGCFTGNSTSSEFGWDLNPTIMIFVHRCFSPEGFTWDDTIGCPRNDNGACENRYGVETRTCPEGKIFDNASHECIEPPVCDGQVNPLTGECPDNCESGHYWSDPNDPSASPPRVYGECVPDLAECAQGSGMGVVDPSQTSIYSTGHNDNMTECIPPPADGCTNLLGKADFNKDDFEFDFCLERAQECDAEGGTYGAVGIDGKTMHVCLVDYGGQTPTCSSGSQYYYDNSDGSSAFACVPVDPPPQICDAQKYDCDGDGQVDDQDNDGCTDNGIANDPFCKSYEEVPGTGEGDDGGSIDDEKEAGDDPLNPPKEGEGDCDPTTTNYAECIGQGVGTEDISDSFKDQLIGDSTGQVNDAIDGYGDAFLDAFGEDGDSGIAAPSGFGLGVEDAFNAGSCTNYSFNWRGNVVTLSCSKTEPVRVVLTWLCSIFTFFAVFNIAMASSPK